MHSLRHDICVKFNMSVGVSVQLSKFICRNLSKCSVNKVKYFMFRAVPSSVVGVWLVGQTSGGLKARKGA